MKSSIMGDKSAGWYISDYSMDKNDDGTFVVRVSLNKENPEPLQQWQNRREWKSYKATATDLQTSLELIKVIGA